MPRALFMTLALLGSLAAADNGSFHDLDRRARAGEPLTVVFFGASLTWGANATDQAHTSYRAVVADRLAQRYPAAPIRCHDAAIGGTGSQLGIFRLERDVLSRRPDLVFLDFTANDDINSDDPETLASYEAIVRRLVEERIQVVQVAFPFQWDIARPKLAGMKRRTAHRAIAEAYGCGWGDAVELAVETVEAGKASISGLWDTDPVHPGDAGYRLFAGAAWQAFEQAVAEGRAGHVPDAMLHPATYATARRVRLAGLGALPRGWSAGRPHLTALYYDFQMSRWLDDLAIAANREGRAEARTPRPVAPLRLTVQAATILLLAESTPQSGRFRVLIDGKAVRNLPGQEKGSDLIDGDKWKTGNGHLVLELARGLDPAVAHAVEIIPAFADDRDQELRIESLCVAGGPATVVLAE